MRYGLIMGELMRYEFQDDGRIVLRADLVAYCKDYPYPASAVTFPLTADVVYTRRGIFRADRAAKRFPPGVRLVNHGARPQKSRRPFGRRLLKRQEACFGPARSPAAQKQPGPG